MMVILLSRVVGRGVARRGVASAVVLPVYLAYGPDAAWHVSGVVGVAPWREERGAGVAVSLVAAGPRRAPGAAQEGRQAAAAPGAHRPPHGRPSRVPAAQNVASIAAKRGSALGDILRARAELGLCLTAAGVFSHGLEDNLIYGLGLHVLPDHGHASQHGTVLVADSELIRS